MKNKNMFILAGIFLVILFNSIVYGALNTDMFIDGEGYVRVDKNIRITNLKVIEQANGAYEIYNSNYSKDTTSLQVALPNIGATIIYEVTVTNKGNVDCIFSELIEESYSNSNIKYELINLEEGDVISAGTNNTFRIEVITVGDGSFYDGSIVLKYIFEELKETEWNFDYTGGEQTFKAPYGGTYKLEVWGAQGGGTYGNGGYSVGTRRLKSKERLYVYVGEQGKNRATGAFNGGGVCYCYIHSDRKECKGGGGASDIRTTMNNNYDDRIIVAGGGGGNYSYENFGYGGGEIAGASAAYLGIRNTYPANGAVGGSCGVTDGSCAGGSNGCNSGYQYTSLFTGGGGGGYTGGVGIYSNTSGPSGSWPAHITGSAAGGTGYIGGVESNTKYSIEAKTISGNQEMPTHDGLSTMTGNTSNGYAKITFVK